MNSSSLAKGKLLLFFAVAAVVLCPIWAVDRFINQDGSGHVNAAYVMLELIRGNSFFANLYSFNSPFVPNSSGHWLMVPLISIFSPFIVTKLMMSVTFVLVAAAVVWLQGRTLGIGGTVTSILIGAVVGLNWLWFLGSYNFMIGLAGFIFTLGLYVQWREELNFHRSAILAILIALVFASHLISFLLLLTSLGVFSIFAASETRKRTIAWTIFIVATAIPLLILYKMLSVGGEPFHPVWRSLADPYSVRSWVTQIFAADPFVIISRKTLPFSQINSTILVFVSPAVWIFVSFTFLVVGTLLGGEFKKLGDRKHLPFVVLFVGSMVAAMFAPDDFGLTNGSILRERILLAGLVFAVPLFNTGKILWAKRAAQIGFAVVIILQTAAIWEYSIKSNSQTNDFVEAAKRIDEGQQIASVVVIDEPARFHAYPTTQMSSYIGIGRNVVVWDNYEMGHYLFPLIQRDGADKKFVFELTTSNIFYLHRPVKDFDRNLSDLDSCLTANNGKIDVMLLSGGNERVETILAKHFETEPYFRTGSVRLYRRLK